MMCICRLKTSSKANSIRRWFWPQRKGGGSLGIFAQKGFVLERNQVLTTHIDPQSKHLYAFGDTFGQIIPYGKVPDLEIRSIDIVKIGCSFFEIKVRDRQGRDAGVRILRCPGTQDAGPAIVTCIDKRI